MEIYLRGCCLCSDPTRMASILSSNLLSGPDDQNLKEKKEKMEIKNYSFQNGDKTTVAFAKNGQEIETFKRRLNQ